MECRCRYLGKIHTELFERLQQTGITDLFNNEDALGRFVPRQPLACWILNVPGGQKTGRCYSGNAHHKPHG